MIKKAAMIDEVLHKRCSACRAYKPLKEFYVQKTGLHGRTSECSECRIERNARYRKEKKTEPKKRRERGASPRAGQNKEWREKNPDYFREYYKKNTERRLELNRQSKKRNPKKDRCRKATHAAIKSKRMSKGKICMICGEEKCLEAHHYGYNSRYAVIFVCRDCHTFIHHTLNVKIASN